MLVIFFFFFFFFHFVFMQVADQSLYFVYYLNRTQRDGPTLILSLEVGSCPHDDNFVQILFCPFLCCI